MAHVPLQLARMVGAPTHRGRPEVDRPLGLAGLAGPSADPVVRPGAAQPAPLPRPGLLELARTSVADLVRWVQVRRALRLHRRRPA